MKLELRSLAGVGGTIELSEEIFSTQFNAPLIHQVVDSYLAGARSGTKSNKSRSDVRGGGRKPWRQKGTGRARAGTIRSPLWRGGGVTFSAKPRDYTKKLNKKMYRVAMRSILSELLRQDRLICVDEFVVNEIKTKAFCKYLADLNLQDEKMLLIILDSFDENVYLSARNLSHVQVITAQEIEPYSLIRFEKALITKLALDRIQEFL